MTAPLVPAQLLGSWHLVRWEILTGGKATLPYGEGATGLLIYAPDGHMSACIAASGRRAFSGGNPRTAPLHDKAAALDGYFHYAGLWQLIPGPKVVHEVTHALNPGFVGSKQVRDAELHEDRLTLSAPEPLPSGLIRHHRLIWRR